MDVKMMVFGRSWSWWWLGRRDLTRGLERALWGWRSKALRELGEDLNWGRTREHSKPKTWKKRKWSKKASLHLTGKVCAHLCVRKCGWWGDVKKKKLRAPCVRKSWGKCSARLGGQVDVREKCETMCLSYCMCSP
jgi:hypothetical protein